MVPDEQRQEYAVVSSLVKEAKRLRTLSGKLMELITGGKYHFGKKNYCVSSIIWGSTGCADADDGKIGDFAVSPSYCRHIWIDQELFKSLLYNLIDNAVKASAIGNVVILEAKRLAENRVRFSIVDHGIGMKELKKFGRLFSRFTWRRQIPHPQAWAEQVLVWLFV